LRLLDGVGVLMIITKNVALSFVLCACLSGGAAAHAQMKPGIPFGWKLHGSRADKFECGIDNDIVKDGKPSAYLRGAASTIPGSGELVQMISPDKYLGGRVMLTGYIKTKDVQDMAGLWMRVGGISNELIGLDTMEDRPVKGSTDWTKFSEVLEVPPDAKDITFGFALHGPGTVWVNGLTLAPAGKSDKITNLVPRKRPPADPVNMDFTGNK